MTVASTINKVSYTAAGSQTVFAYTFKIYVDADLKVYVNGILKTLTTDYTVSGAGVSSGGNVTFGTGLTVSDVVVIERVLTLTQGTDYVENDPFPAETHEAALDRLTFISQQHQDALDRTVKFATTVTDAGDVEVLGSVSARANKLFAFDSAGDLDITQEIGVYRGSDTTTTTVAYIQRDLVKSTTTAQLNNVYICTAASAVGILLTNTAYWALVVDAVTAASSASAAAASAAAALVSENNAQSSEDDAAADLVLTNADVVLTHADVVLTHADELLTRADTVATAADLVATNQDTIDTAADLVATNQDTIDTAADVVLTHADVVTTGNNVTTATTQAGNAATSATLAEDWASKTTGTVDGTNYSSKYYATNANVGTVATNIANVNTVAGISANVTTVAGISADVTAAATNASDITAVAAEVAKVVAVANDLAEATSEIDVVAASIANVDLVGGSITNVNEVATNLGSVNAFGEQYRVAATAPTTSLDAGDLWFDTTSGTMKVYDGSGFVNAGSSVNGIENSVEHIATAGQTSFAATYDAGYLNVFLNGVKLDASDYTATDGANVVLDTGAALNDSVFVQSFGTFTLADHYSKTASDARFEPIDSAYTKSEGDARYLQSVAADSVGASELKVTGNGTAGQYLGSDADGTFTWTSISADPTMGGDLSGTASNAQIVANAVGNAEMANDAIGVAELSATGTASSSTYLRGDNTWTTAGLSAASDAEVRTGTLTTKAVTPANIKATQIGWGQTMQDLGGSRSFATTYTNSTGRPIFVSVRAYYASGAMQIDNTINGIGGQISAAPAGWWCSLSFIVPNGGTYKCAASTHTAKGWCEIR